MTLGLHFVQSRKETEHDDGIKYSPRGEFVFWLEWGWWFLKLSIIVPTRNEADYIVELLKQLQPARDAGHEVLVVDGGSLDGTLDQVYHLVDHATTSQMGRAYQQNEGAARSSGDILWFLHADSQVSEQCVSAILDACAETGTDWGWFSVRLSGSSLVFRIIEWCMNQRAKISQIATGDQGLFVRRETFDRIGGFPEIALMEDIALCKQLKAHGEPVCLNAKLVTSSRRWEQRGILRTVVLMWGLRLAYFAGANPELLHRVYSGKS